jgi:hypothetical protein
VAGSTGVPERGRRFAESGSITFLGGANDEGSDAADTLDVRGHRTSAMPGTSLLRSRLCVSATARHRPHGLLVGISRPRMVLAAVIGAALGLGGLFAIGGTATGHSDPSRAEASVGRVHVASAYDRLPLSFVENRGEMSAAARYFAQGRGYELGLTGSGVLLSLAPSSGGTAELQSDFVGAASHPQLAATDPLPGKMNYFIGRNPSQWVTGVPTFSRVVYDAVWPGIDVSFNGNQGEIEYDYEVAPGADPARIGQRFTGARSLHIDRSGALDITVGTGIVRELPPQTYQLVFGHRHSVESHYVLSDGQIGIAVGGYDHRLPLVIDPMLSYSTYLGGSGTDIGADIAVDKTGDAFVTGATSSTNFPTTSAAFQTASAGGKEDVFVSKLNATGTAPLYSTYVGGSGSDYGTGIAIDSSGDAYVAGHTASSDFPTTTGAFQTTLEGTAAGFALELNPSDGT